MNLETKINLNDKEIIFLLTNNKLYGNMHLFNNEEMKILINIREKLTDAKIKLLQQQDLSNLQ